MAKKSKADTEIPLMILTNERTPMKAQMLLMLYKAASIGQLAYMDGMDPDTGEIVQLIVGLEPTENGKLRVFPLAKIFNKIDGIPHYLVPDGEGNYIDYRTDESGTIEPSAKALPEREEDRQAAELGTSADGDGGTLARSDDKALL